MSVVIKHLRLVLFVSLLAMTLLACGGDDNGNPGDPSAKTTWGAMTWGTDCWKDPCQ